LGAFFSGVPRRICRGRNCHAKAHSDACQPETEGLGVCIFLRPRNGRGEILMYFKALRSASMFRAQIFQISKFYQLIKNQTVALFESKKKTVRETPNGE
jgi:hypothetical protein